MAAEKGSSPTNADTATAANADAPVRLTSTYRTDHPYHVHISYVWLRPVLTSLAIVAAIVVNNIGQTIQIARDASEHLPFTPGPLVILAVLGILAACYLVFIGFSLLAYRNLTFTFGPSDFSLRSGVVSKHRLHLPYARVQSVSHRATILQRLLGVCDATIESAGGSSNTAIKIPYLTLSDVERLRVELFTRKEQLEIPESELVYDASLDTSANRGARKAAGASPTPAGFGQQNASVQPPYVQTPNVAAASTPERPVILTPEEQEARRQSVSEVLAGTEVNRLAGSVGGWRGALAGNAHKEKGASFEAGLTNAELLLASISTKSFWYRVIAPLAAFAAFLPTLVDLPILQTLPIVAQILGGFLVITVLAVLYGVVEIGGFTVRRREGRIEAEWGMLNHRYSGLEVDRVQALVIRQGLVHRALHRCEVYVEKIAAVEASSRSNISTEGQLLHPFLRMSELGSFLQGMLPEFEGRPARSELVALERPRVMRRAIIRNLFIRSIWFWIALGSAIAIAFLTAEYPVMETAMQWTVWMLWIALIACVIGMCASVISAILWVRESGYALNHDFATIINGGLGIKTLVLPRHKAQSFFMRSNPFQRHAHLATIGCSYAALAAKTGKLMDVDEKQARAWVQWLKPRRSAEV